MASTGVENFKKIYKAPDQVKLLEVIRIAQVFPAFVDEDDNLALMEEVSAGDLKALLQSFQKDKSPRPDGWRIEFFLDILTL